MELFQSLLPSFLEGTQVTLFYWFMTLILASLCTIPLTYFLLYAIRPIQLILRFYIYLMRGTPLMLQLMFFFFGLPYLGITLDRMEAAIIALVLNYAAYFMEILRGGVQSVDSGQSEAAYMLGYSQYDTFFKILLPQAFKNALPSFSNECLTLLKDTCLVSVLGIDELLRYGKIAVSTYSTALPFIYIALIYLILNVPITRMIGFIERKLNYYE